jgi:hypothetical protein
MNNASRSVAWERILPPATLLLLSLLASGPLWGAGLLNTRGGGDSPFLLLRTHQLVANLRAGVFPVRWMPDAAYGFGYPFFSYYAALPYYFAAGFELLGIDIVTAIKLTQTLFLAGSAVAMYRWAEQVLRSRAGAWLAAVAYGAAPFHLVNLYVRGDSLSEFAAFAFYPLILWGFDRLATQPSIRRALFPALAYAGLIVTHNVSALIFSPFILLYVAFHIAREAIARPARPFRDAIAHSSLLILPLLIALLLSAWFWVPALAETGYVQLSAQTSGYFFYGNHFRGTDLVQRKLLFDYATGGESNSPFAMGLVQAALAVAGASVVLFSVIRSQVGTRARRSRDLASRVQKRPLSIMGLGFCLLGLLLSTWLITPLSRLVWDHLPLLPMVQFPWRFLSVQALFTALLSGAGIRSLGAQRRYLGWVTALALGTLLIAAALMDLQPEYLAVSAHDVNPERLQLYELFTGNVGSTIRHEYLPTWVKPRPYVGPGQVSPDAPPRAISVSGSVLDASRLTHRPTHRVWQVETGDEGAEIALPLYYWPGWRAVVDGTRQEVEPAAGSGYLSLYVPPGRHTVKIRLGRTPLRFGAEVASLVATLAVVTIYVRGWSQPGAGEREDGERGEQAASTGLKPALSDQGAAIPYLLFITVLSLVATLHPRVSSSSSDDLTMDFDEKPYLHHNPDGAPFEGWELTSYRYGDPGSPGVRTIAPGDSLPVTLDWRRVEDSPTTRIGSPKLRLISPAAVRNDEMPVTAEATIGLGQRQVAPGVSGSTVITLSIPEETAPGIYLLRIEDASRTYLRPVWIDSRRASGAEPVRATFAEGAVRLHDVQATQPTSDRLQIQLDWSATEPVAANYGLNLSLADVAGNEWLYQGNRMGYDTQPGHGFLPTSLWPPEHVIHDRHIPAVLSGVPPGASYTLTVNLYRVATWQSVGHYSMTIPLTLTTERPDAPIVARFGGELALSWIEAPQSVWQGENLETTAYWSIVEEPSEDYTVEWQLEGSGRSIANTQPLAPGSSPQDWSAGAWIAGRAALPIPPAFPPGDYTLSLTLIEPRHGNRVDSYTHPTPVEIRGRERVWELPEMDERVGARFGDMIELTGYDLRKERESLHLTLYWQALTTPDRDYVFFVHLADRETGEPASQVDTMPRGYNYPTGLWAPGEVVSDEVELSTGDAKAGRYDLAVGWYDPETKQRLQAVNSEGDPLPDDRLLLPHSVTLP